MTPSPLPRQKQIVPTQRDVAASRVRFLTAESPEPQTVRSLILASWRRSHDLQVSADNIEMSYVSDLDADTPLARSAEPVLRLLREQLEGQSVSVILTDQTGLVLSRLTGDRDLERHLDKVLLAPGFSYAEKFVGTNGIGTALEVGGPAHVFGHEHYAENLEDLACAGVPIHHPVSGRMIGAIDLTCWRKDAGALLTTLAQSTAKQIRQALLADVGSDQLALFEEYLRTCSRSAGAVVAVNGDMVMLNEHARAMFDPADQAAVLAHATEVLTHPQQATLVVDLPSGSAVRMHVRSVRSRDRAPAGVVAQVKLEDPREHVVARRDKVPQMPLPGLVGSSAGWRHVCQELETVFRSGEWLAVEGEPGVGKLALLRAVQLRRQPVGRFALIDADDIGSSGNTADAADMSDMGERLSSVRLALNGDADTVVIRHVDRLDPAALRGLAAALDEAREPGRVRPLWVAVTLANTTKSKDLLHLLRLFPSSLEVPPLRLHIEDLNQLVPLLLGRLGQGGQLACSPEAMRLLMRMSWPGNTEQVHQMLRKVVAHRRTGYVTPEDLPPEVHAVSRRVLSPLESLERDAIVRCLTDADGNKLQAARSLGMSRATIYRKIRDYGIVAPVSH